MSDLSPMTSLSWNLKNLSTLENTPFRPVLSPKFIEFGDNFSCSGFSPPLSELPSVERNKSEVFLHSSSADLVQPNGYRNKVNSSTSLNPVGSPCDLSKQALPDSHYSGFALSPSWSNAAGKNEDDVKVPDITCLLTQPLLQPRRPPKNGISSIRRCLSLEMDSGSSSNSVNGPAKRRDPTELPSSQQCKRRKRSSLLVSPGDPPFKRSYSETAVMRAVQQAHLNPGLIGDGSKCFALPLIRGRHQDLKCISAQTMAQVIQKKYSCQIDQFTVVDCRYPYEFEGGHIKGALNIYSKEGIQETFLSKLPPPGRNIIIFHCEFSSKRAPKLCRYLRNQDRELNEENYPKLFHPEIYLLEGGYKDFVQNFKRYCEPQGYLPMNHKDYCRDLRYYRPKSKSFRSNSNPCPMPESTSLYDTL